MSLVFHRSLSLKGPAGRLEALLWTSPKPEAPLAALVCHPHPLFSGTMHNKVVFHVARTLHRVGLPVLRFNFRGVGLSEGTYDAGRGEGDDVRTALDYLAEQCPGRPLLVAGFSFGCWVGLRTGCGDERVTELAGLGLPVNNTDMTFLHQCAKPKILLQGGRDQFGAREKVEQLIKSVPEPKRMVFVEEADHFFAGKLDEVDAALRGWLVERHPELQS